MMTQFRKECPLERIQCEYHNVGCKVKMARKDREKHKKKNMEDHLKITTLALNDTELELANTKETLADTKHELSDAKNQLTSMFQHINSLEVLMYLAVTRPTSSAAVVLPYLHEKHSQPHSCWDRVGEAWDTPPYVNSQ